MVYIDREAIRARAADEHYAANPLSDYVLALLDALDEAERRQHESFLHAEAEARNADEETARADEAEARNAQAKEDLIRLLVRASRAEKDADQLATELDKHGYGDFHYNSSDYRDPAVLRSIAAHTAAVAARGEQ